MSYNQIYSDEIYKLSNQESKNILEDYQMELRSRNRSPKTIEQYSSDIRLFICWAYDSLNNKSLLEYKRRDFRNFILYLQSTNKSANRINRVMSSLRGILQYCEDDTDIYDSYIQNPMRKIKSIERDKEEIREGVFLEDKEVDYLISYLVSHNKLQQALYVSLSYSSAGRRNEVLQVTKQSFLEDGVHKTNKIRGKGGKQFNLMYDKRTKLLAQEYLAERTDDLDTLWITNKNDPRPISYESLHAWCISFRAILENEFDKPLPISAHDFRRSALENYENSTHHSLQYMNIDKLDLNTLKILAHHDSVQTTEGYLRDKSSDILDNLFGN